MSRHLPRIQLPFDRDGFDEIVDVRSPGEFAEDHVEGAVNLPVLSDKERAEVGTIYKQTSPFEARRLGAALVSRNIASHLETHFQGKPRDHRLLLYCWRGGQRSASFATVLDEVGWDVSLIDGGYKSYRSHVVDTIAKVAPQLRLIVLNGYTGAGKTLLLAKLKEEGAQVIDLEGFANHKGSVFGGDPKTPQPAQKHFESMIYRDLVGIDLAKPLFIEAESAKIGRLNLPNPLWQKMKASPVVEIDSPVESRARYLADDYEEWVGNLERVHATIDRLTEFHSKKRLARWKDMTADGEWIPFVEDLLIHHYDTRYTVDGSGNYPVPTASVALPHHGPEAVAAAAEELQALAPGVLS
ncbi:MAG: tRNA 2-selenouridine(34) synthase MnmH [Verrucomicrobiota bacterium]